MTNYLEVCDWPDYFKPLIRSHTVMGGNTELLPSKAGVARIQPVDLTQDKAPKPERIVP